MSKVTVTLKRSLINRPYTQMRTIEALGLNRVGSTTVKADTPQIRGMIKKVAHLVEVKDGE